MNELTLHPNVYATGRNKGLIHLLERAWVQEHRTGEGDMFIVSGFGNYNGGVRFFEIFRRHTQQGGQLTAIFAGSTSSRLTSKQVVAELLSCGANVYIINRKRLLHAKCYGTRDSNGDSLIVTSGNFTGPGMSQNVEMSLFLEAKSTNEMNFSWYDMLHNMFEQNWSFYQPSLSDLTGPAWQLLYDEKSPQARLDDTSQTTMLLTLSHADTARINAARGTNAAKGSQYFWLSKDCYDFFPTLNIRNERGHKATYSCIINMNYLDLQISDPRCRVTFEAENNLDFRLGTGKLRYTRVASQNDLVAISRISEHDYNLRVFQQGTIEYSKLIPYATSFIGHQGKRYGYIENTEFNTTINISS